MTAALQPPQALAYMALLTRNLRAGIVVSSDGRALAGDASLLEEVVEGIPSPEGVESREIGSGTLFIARGQTAAIAVVARKNALTGLLERDLRTVLSQMA